MLDHPAFRRSPTLAHFARDGEWEQAWCLSVGSVPDEREVLRFCAGAEELAFELFYGQAFLGARVSGSAAEVQAFALRCSAVCARPSAGVRSLRRILGAADDAQFESPVAYAEIGAVNAWQSVGAHRIDDLSLAAEELAALLARVKSTPLGRNSEHPKALELVFQVPVQHWCALPVSSDAPPYALNPKLLREALTWGQADR